MQKYISFNKKYLTFVSTSILGMLGSVGTIIADTFFISQQLGSDGLAALNIALPIFGVLAGLGLMIAIGGGSRFTILREQNKENKAQATYTTAFYLALTISVILFSLGLFATPLIVKWLGASKEIFSLCHTYLKTILLFAPGFIFNYLWVAFIRNDGNAHYPMMAMLFNNAMNIILDYLFMYPFHMGIFGSALATGLSPLFGIIVSLFYFKRHRAGFYLTKPTTKAIVPILSLGSSTLVNELSTSIVILVFNALIMKYSSTLGIAAYGVVANYALVMTSIFTGLAQGTQPLLSQAYGKKEVAQEKITYQTSLLMALIIGILAVLIVYLWTQPLVTFFNSEHQAVVQTMAEKGMRLYFLGFILCGMNIVTTFLFSSIEKPRISLTLSIFRGCIGLIIIVIILAYFLHMTGIWLAFCMTESVTFVLSLPFLKRYVYPKNKVALCDKNITNIKKNKR